MGQSGLAWTKLAEAKRPSSTEIRKHPPDAVAPGGVVVEAEHFPAVRRAAGEAQAFRAADRPSRPQADLQSCLGSGGLPQRFGGAHALAEQRVRLGRGGLCLSGARNGIREHRIEGAIRVDDGVGASR